MVDTRKRILKNEIATKLICGTLIFVASYLTLRYFLSCLGGAPYNSDTMYDYFSAKRCVDLGQCNFHGAESGFLGFYHSTLWIRFLWLTQKIGLSLDGTHQLVLVCHALAVATFYFVAKSVFGLRAPLLYTLFYFVLSIGVAEFPILRNHGLAPLPVALFYLTFFFAIISKTTKAWLVSTFCLAIAIMIHLSSVLLVPAFVVMIMATSRLPIFSLLASCLFGFVILTLESWQVTSDNIIKAMNLNIIWPAVIVFLAFVVIGSIFRKKICLFDRKKLVWFSSIVMFISITAITIVPMLLGKQGFTFRYLSPVAPVLIIFLLYYLWMILKKLFGFLKFGRQSGLFGVLTAIPCFLFAAWFVVVDPIIYMEICEKTRTPNEWKISELALLANHVYGLKGWSWKDLESNFPGGDLQERIRPIESMESLFSGYKERQKIGGKVLIVRTDRKLLPKRIPENWDIVQLSADAVAIIRVLKNSYIDQTEGEFCVRTLDNQDFVPRCRKVKEIIREIDERSNGMVCEPSFTLRSNDRPRSKVPFEGMLPPEDIKKKHGFHLEFRVDMNVTSDDDHKFVFLFNFCDQHLSGWKFKDAQGYFTLSTTRSSLVEKEGAKRLIAAISMSPEMYSPYYPSGVEIVELTDADIDLQRAFCATDKVDKRPRPSNKIAEFFCH